MLGKFYRIHVVNNSGQTVTGAEGGVIEVRITPVQMTPKTGKLFYGGVVVEDIVGTATADGDDVKTAEQDNSTDLFPNALVALEVKHDEGAAADGTFDIYYESGAGASSLPSDQDGYSDPETNAMTFIGSLIWDASPSDDETLMSMEFLI